MSSDRASGARTAAPPGLLALKRKAETAFRGRLVFVRDYDLKVVKQHRCSVRHRSHKRLVGCIFGRNLLWVEGFDAPFAAVTMCRGKATVSLWREEATARAVLEQLDRGLCGPGCTSDHALIRFVK